MVGGFIDGVVFAWCCCWLGHGWVGGGHKPDTVVGARGAGGGPCCHGGGIDVGWLGGGGGGGMAHGICCWKFWFDTGGGGGMLEYCWFDGGGICQGGGTFIPGGGMGAPFIGWFDHGGGGNEFGIEWGGGIDISGFNGWGLLNKPPLLFPIDGRMELSSCFGGGGPSPSSAIKDIYSSSILFLSWLIGKLAPPVFFILQSLEICPAPPHWVHNILFVTLGLSWH